MELTDLKRKVQAARRFAVEIDGRSFTLQRPSRFDMQMAAAQAGMAHGDPGARLHWERLVLLGAIVGWQGVTVADLGLPEAGPLDHDDGAVLLLLDAQPEWGDQLAQALWERLAQASEVEGTAAKN